MKDELKEYEDNTFEGIKYTTDDGVEFWSARDLMPLFGYGKEWRYFKGVIVKAQVAAEKSGYAVDNHFVAGSKKVSVGYGNTLEVDDYMLTRYACYLIAQNGNPRFQEISDAMTYFAGQTIRQEQYDKLSPDAKRLVLRDEIVSNNKKLNSAAKRHGVKNYGIFHDAGYKGLYGMSLKQVAIRKGLGKDSVLDRGGSAELAANLFRVTQTEEQLHKAADNGEVLGEARAAGIHNMVGGKVRQTIKDIGGTLPEDLKPEEHIKELKKKLKADAKRKLQSAEKPLKITGGLDSALGKIAKAPKPDK